MPTWFIYALLGTAVYTVVNFTDKYILEKQIKDYRGMAMYSAIVGLIVGTILWIFNGFPILSTKDALLVLLSGVFSIWAAAIYFQVMQNEEASKVIFLFQLIPVSVLLLSFLFLGQSITLKHIVGFFLILIPSLLVTSLDGKSFTLKVDKTLILMIIVDILWATGQVLFKFVVEPGSFTKVVAYESWGWAIGGLLLFSLIPSVRKAFWNTTKALKPIALGIVFTNEFVFILSKLLTFFAISLGPVYLISVLGGTGVFFGILYGWVLTLIAPKIFGEDITKKGLLIKFILGVLMFGGIALIY